MSTMTMTATAEAPSASRLDSVPLCCYGNGRRLTPSRNQKMARTHPELIVPSKALEEFMKNKPELLQPRWGPALLQLGGTAALVAFSGVLLAYSPWFFLPVAWMIAGVALSLLFIIGHDCAHGNWAPSPVVNQIVGELSFLLLLQPFESFKQLHYCAVQSHAATTPAPAAAEKKAAGKPTSQRLVNDKGQSVSIESPCPENTEPLPWWLQAFGEHLANNYQLTKLPASTNPMRARISIALSAVFSATLVLYLVTVEPLAVARFWGVPLLAYCAVYSGVCRLFTLNVRAFLPKDSPHATSIASYNYALFTALLAKSSEYGAAVRNSSLVSLIKAWYPRINWVNFVILTSVPVIALVGLFTTPLQRPTAIWALFYYFITGLGITAGYHRLFAHRAYEANWLARAALIFAGSGALEGSIKWWCGGHRVHHRYTDTPKDPYNSGGGFWYAHIGWMLIKPDPANHAKADIKDLDNDPLIRFQHKYYLYVGPFCALVFPTLVAGLGWGDWLGGYFYAGAARLFFVHHSTFCVNSVAHYFGEHSYDDERTPRDHFITALLTFGEGYHNFHHEFPNDYRNGIQWYHYDPTKWLIAGLAKLGATFNLRVFPKNEIRRGIVYMREKKLAEMRKEIVAPADKGDLPTWTWPELKEKVAAAKAAAAGASGEGDKPKQSQLLIVVDGFVHDVTKFLPSHPGGAAYLNAYNGRDATSVFFGRTEPVVYKHSHAAHNLLSNMRVAVIEGQDESSKKEQ